MGCGAGKTPPPQTTQQQIKTAQPTVSGNDAVTKPPPDAPRKPLNKAELLQFIQGIPLFTKLQKADQEKLTEVFESREFADGNHIVRQGDVGDELFIIAHGTAVVKMNAGGNAEMVVASLQDGEFFGENVLLRPDQTRNATISAKGALTCYSLSRTEFEKLGLREKVSFPKRKAVPVSEGNNTNRVQHDGPKSTKKTKVTENILANALKSNANLKAMLGDLEDEQVRGAISKAWRLEVAKGKELVVQGDEQADCFYLVEKGKFEVFIQNNDNSTVEQLSAAAASVNPSGFSAAVVRQSVSLGSVAARKSQLPGANQAAAPAVSRTLVAEKGPGSSFGELALIHSAPRAATIQCSEDAIVWVIDRQDFKSGLIEYAEKQADQWCGLLENVDLIQKLSAEERRAISQECVEVHYHDDEYVITQGEDGNSFFIIQVGTCNCVINGDMVKTMMRGDFFGEKALLTNEPRAASIVVAPDYGGADLLRLDQEAFEATLGPKAFGRVKHLFLKATAAINSMKTAENKKELVIAPSKLEMVGTLGCGGFGKTTLVKDADTGKTYALKHAAKGRLQAKSMEASAVNEKDNLWKCSSPFVVGLHCTYRDGDFLYFVLDACLGGELCSIYQRKGLHGNEDMAKFYVACVAQALFELTKHQIIHRDIRSENVLIDDKGYGKLCNFGLAKVSIGRTYTFCGTPEYLAPEVVSLKTGYKRPVDWWALGVLLFELMTGDTPFDASDPMQIYKNIKVGVEHIKWPAKFSDALRGFNSGLLDTEPAGRIGMRGKAARLTGHEWYSGFAWSNLEKQSMESLYKPVVSGPEDVSNFPQNIEEPKMLPYNDGGQIWDEQFGPLVQEMEERAKDPEALN